MTFSEFFIIFWLICVVVFFITQAYKGLKIRKMENVQFSKIISVFRYATVVNLNPEFINRGSYKFSLLKVTDNKLIITTNILWLNIARNLKLHHVIDYSNIKHIDFDSVKFNFLFTKLKGLKITYNDSGRDVSLIIKAKRLDSLKELIQNQTPVIIK